MPNINKKTYYEGKTFTTSGGNLLILGYKNGCNVKVKFLNTGYETTTSMSNIKSGSVKNWLLPTVFGIGINDIKESFQSPFYSRWKDMLRRCYDKNYIEEYPTYANCRVCDEWLTLSNFKHWMEQQDWEGNHLDKDIIGCGKVYSPDNCIFIDPKINTLITDAGSIRGEYPLGVHKDGNQLRVKCRDPFLNKAVNIARLDLNQAEEGHKLWMDYKLYLVERFYKEGFIKSEEVYKKLKNRYTYRP